MGYNRKYFLWKNKNKRDRLVGLRSKHFSRQILLVQAKRIPFLNKDNREKISKPKNCTGSINSPPMKVLQFHICFFLRGIANEEALKELEVEVTV